MAPATVDRDPRPTTTVFELVTDPGARGVGEAYARRKILRLAHLSPAPLLHARVRLVAADGPGPAWAARATLDVGGRLVRGHAVGRDLLEAIDLLHERLHDQLLRLGDRRHGTRTAGRGTRRSSPAATPSRPASEQQIVRHTTFSPGLSTLDEAAFDLDMLDDEFLLFREAATGCDAVVHHRDDGRLGLLRYGPPPEVAEPLCPSVASELVVEGRPPELDVASAIERMELSGERFVAATDPDTGRALVVHRRWDGRWGVVAPVAEPAPPAEPATARRRLRAERDRLEHVRRTLWDEGLDAMTESQDVAELSAADQHPADLGTETFERERDLSLLSEVDAEIEAVDRALVRLDAGAYGRCDACGEPIPDDRLRAVPAARFCLAHQRHAESVWPT
jgi:RNA polymerase-binding transcription factor DksA/ribosome-associated translation inhibitor RaiA